MNTKTSKISESHRFKLDLTDKLNLKNPNKNMALANLSTYYTWKTSSQNTTTKNLKFLHQLGMILLIYLMVLTQFLTFKIFFEFIIKKQETLTENSPVQIYPNKIKNGIVFKTKTGYKLGLLTFETMRLLGSTKKDVDADKNGEIIPKLESAEVVLVHCNLVKNNYQHTSKVLFSLF